VPSPGRLRGVLVGIALLSGLIACAPAGADVFGSIALVSASPTEQADYAHDPAISGNGQYAVFDGSIGGVTGVWRRENRPAGAVEEVAGGDAELPSISANGQYVSFTTNEGAHLPEITGGLPDPKHETHEAPNVYVRNMALPPTDPAAFELASAVSGSTQALTYEYASKENTPKETESRQKEVEEYGSLAAGRSALSANGREVAFVTTALSDLNQTQAEIDANGSAAITPPLEVAVRDLETDTTEIVSVEYDPATGTPAIDGETGRPRPAPVGQEGSITYGAVYSEHGIPKFIPAVPYTVSPSVGASISGDGSTVAWMGQQIAAQVPTLAGESLRPKYAEPLWRRIVDGPLVPTRRVAGGSDPTNPDCAASGETELPEQSSLSDPCQGPFKTEPTLGVWTGGGEGDVVPRLSENGETVLFIANAPLVALGSDFGLDTSEGRNGDLYVASMREGLSRQQAVTPLTEIASGEEKNYADNAPIVDMAISADGTQVAFATKRIVFPLGVPAYVSAPLSVPGMVELYEIDLADETLTRVTEGYEGGPSEHPHQTPIAGSRDQYTTLGDGSLSPSFSGNGDLLAFSSTASNLVYGDGNTPNINETNLDGSDAFVVPRVVFGATPTPEVISAAPPNPTSTPSWRLQVTASTSANGSVRLFVEAPGAGTLRAGASAAMKISSAVTGRAGDRARHVRSHVSVRTLTVATAKRLEQASGGGLVTLVLTPAPKYKALAARPGGLSANAEVAFSAPGHPVLHASIEVTFLRKGPVRASRKSGSPGRFHGKARGGKRS